MVDPKFGPLPTGACTLPEDPSKMSLTRLRLGRCAVRVLIPALGLGSTHRAASREVSLCRPSASTAILAADVAGDSRLMSADEEGTRARLKAHRRELIDPKVAEHRGRLVKTTGDGILIEFPSVVDAVRCAIDVQCAMAECNADKSEGTRIEFRVGINLGDIIIIIIIIIIIEGDDIHARSRRVRRSQASQKET